MSSKHEPGPWILGGASGRMITTPSGYYGDGFIADVDTKANAKLIAAAPDLLETLERLLLTSCAAVDPSKDNIYMKKFYEARDKAFEAIKKATL